MHLGCLFSYRCHHQWFHAIINGVVPSSMVPCHHQWCHAIINGLKTLKALADANHVANEVVGAIRTVFSFATEPMEHGRCGALLSLAANTP
jgi:hypothetical protein